MINPNKLEKLISSMDCDYCPLDNICGTFPLMACEKKLHMWLNDELPEWCPDGCADEDLEITDMREEDDGELFKRVYNHKCRKCGRNWQTTEYFRLVAYDKDPLDDRGR